MIRGVDLDADVSGEGPDVVWGHGLTSSRASEDELGLIDWSAIRSASRVLRYDARGHGTSGSTPDPADYSWRSLAEDQLALADEFGIGAYVAGGASMGCATALHAAVLAPGRVRGLLLVIPPTAWAIRAAQTAAYRVMADLVEAGDHESLLRGAAASPPPDPFAEGSAVGRSLPRSVGHGRPGSTRLDLPGRRHGRPPDDRRGRCDRRADADPGVDG
jgi:pimeloyl-ACP methyl ester carboxylesterase